MYPPQFDYAAASTLDQALALLAEHGDEAKVIAGGQSLIPLLKLRFAAPTILIDINSIADLNVVEERGNQICIGAMARHSELAEHPLLSAQVPVITSAAQQIADPLIRNLGTIGGSLVHADPAGDWGSTMLALEAEVVVKSASGERVIPIDDFFQGALMTVIEPNELMTEIRIPKPRSSSGGAYLKLERKVGDFATAAAAVQLELENGKIARAGIGLTAVGLQNIRATAAEDALRGAEAGREAFAQAAQLAAQATDPNTDIRGSADYKRDVIRVFVERGLQRALDIARG